MLSQLPGNSTHSQYTIYISYKGIQAFLCGGILIVSSQHTNVPNWTIISTTESKLMKVSLSDLTVILTCRSWCTEHHCHIHLCHHSNLQQVPLYTYRHFLTLFFALKYLKINWCYFNSKVGFNEYELTVVIF